MIVTIPGAFDIAHATQPKAPPTAAQIHARRCLERCAAAVGEIVAAIDRAKPSEDRAVLREQLMQGSRAIYAGLRSHTRDGVPTLAAGQLIAGMRDANRSPLPTAIRNAISAARSIGVSMPPTLAQAAATPSPDEKQSEEDQALEGAIQSAESLQEAAALVTSKIATMPNEATDVEIKSARKCSAALTAATTKGTELQSKLDDIVIAKKPAKSAARAQARPAGRLMIRRPSIRPAPARPLTPVQRAQSEWSRMDQMERSRWIDAATFVRQRTKEITRSV